MKREIKFRGKCLNGEWIYGSLVIINGRSFVFNDDMRKEVDPSTVGEYTGLKDKNDKEIYEGDIISVIGYIHKVIEYREDHAAFCMANIDHLGRKFIYPWQEIRPNWWKEFKREILVIGNVHDNPELLEDKE